MENGVEFGSYVCLFTCLLLPLYSSLGTHIWTKLAGHSNLTETGITTFAHTEEGGMSEAGSRREVLAWSDGQISRLFNSFKARELTSSPAKRLLSFNTMSPWEYGQASFSGYRRETLVDVCTPIDWNAEIPKILSLRLAT